MAIKNCGICLEDYPKINAVITKCCTKRICPDCRPKLDKCPFCRVIPLETLTLIKQEPVQPIQPILSISQNEACERLNTEVANILCHTARYNYKCICRSDCKHKRCSCSRHNLGRQTRTLKEYKNFCFWAIEHAGEVESSGFKRRLGERLEYGSTLKDYYHLENKELYYKCFDYRYLLLSLL
jgi:hypothetical protein